MFGARKAAQAAASQPSENNVVMVAPESEPPQPELPRISAGKKKQVLEYFALAKDINFTPGYLLHERILVFCEENDIPVYDLSSVETFLDKKSLNDKEADGHWVWIPLRREDMGKLVFIGRRSNSNNKYKLAGYIANDRQYHALIPLPILQRVQKLAKEFPEASFYVSDISPRTDPFIIIMGLGHSPIVFARWNEPGFE